MIKLPTPLASVDEIVELFQRGASLSETPNGFSLEQHGLQCAELIERWYPDDVELQVAGLLHDLAHHDVAEPAIADHDEHSHETQAEHSLAHGVQGAALVSSVLGRRVGQHIEWHVPAKRYLITYDSQYFEGLSEVSVRTLSEQGGPMTMDEGNRYRVQPEWNLALALRRADDSAKVAGHPTKPFDYWIEKLRWLAEVQRQAVFA